MPEEHSLLEQRIKWEQENPRPEQLRKAEEMIVRGICEYELGNQFQVTRQNSFDICTDEGLTISVHFDPTYKKENPNG
jgi:hypothetical protein